MTVIDKIFMLFDQHGSQTYLGESVSLTQHMLQSAQAAERESAGSVLIAAALLHDIGHLLHDHDEDCAQRGIDSQHEDLAGIWLETHFAANVTEPVRLHVSAKRYLCTVEPDYMNELSSASIHSLNLQGGPMSSEEVKDFESHTYFREAVRLRRWDDLAKDPEVQTPPLEHYRPHLASVLCKPDNVS